MGKLESEGLPKRQSKPERLGAIRLEAVRTRHGTKDGEYDGFEREAVTDLGHEVCAVTVVDFEEGRGAS